MMPGVRAAEADESAKQKRADLQRRSYELNQKAFEFYQQGKFADATKPLEQALAMRQRLYPTDKYPQGHPELAASLDNLGLLLQSQGEYAKALEYQQQAVAMYQRLYPRDRYPQGHRDLALSFNNLGALLYHQGKYDKALGCYRQALAMYQRLYPKAKYPHGHPDLAQNLNNLGTLLTNQGEYGNALQYHQQALAMYQRLYPKVWYPQGHPDLAQSLNNLGSLLQRQAEYAKALPYFQQALAMRQRLYPRDQYPQGHPDLAGSLNSLGLLLQKQGEYAKALDYYQQALAMYQRLYPKDKYPQGHPDLAASLNNLGGLLRAQGDYAKALPYYQQTLAMYQRLYPKDKYPQGHPDLAGSLNNLGDLLDHQGEYGKALDYYQQALAMYQRLYPKDKYPQGHPDLAGSLNNLGAPLRAQGEYAKALDHCQRALAMYQRLYPKDKYPQGHPVLAMSFNNLGVLLDHQGEYAKALDYYQQALAMTQRLYPRDKYPQGHPELAASLNNLGGLLQAQGEYAKALDYDQQALAIHQRLYPRDKYPQGHPDLANSLNDLAFLNKARGEYGKALDYLQQGLTMQENLADVFTAATSEAEALQYTGSLPVTRDVLLSVARLLPAQDDSSYAHVWRGKAAVTRMLAQRQQALTQAILSSGPMTGSQKRQVRRLWQDLLSTRRSLARLLLAPPGDARDHRQRLQQFSEQKEDLERQLAGLLPAFARRQELERLGHHALLKRLPARTAFIDLVRYVRFEQNPKVAGRKGESRTPCYVAFVLRRGQPVRRVELEAAELIEKAVLAWRQDIQAERNGPAAHTLRRLLWAPLAAHLPADTQTVLLAPDAALATLPWAALPGKQKDTVLLDEYALAVVPHGPFLLERLSAEPQKDNDAGLLLAVGGVRYDQPPRPVKGEREEMALNRSAELGGKAVHWRYLPGTLQEVDKIVDLAGKRTTVRLRGSAAGTGQLVAELPRARWVHLATHGFFADSKVRSILQIDESLFRQQGLDKGPPPGARNPLVLSGLVLAGANRPSQRDEFGIPQGDAGILTAEAIAGLPLQDLELAVLSACDTGLGEVGGGEGVFGLQRAFHLAGTHNVVASLWQVDDDATAALMGLFYHKMWHEKKPPIVALREAQLTLYRHPDRIGVLARARALDFDKAEPLPAEAAAGGKERRPGGRAAIKLWAAFLLSGTGR
jgi:tetratricopeptide (TPR) repeat protein